MSNLQFAGSKKKAKSLAREARIKAAFQQRIDRIYELSRLIKTEDELNRYLEAITDDTVRAETKKLIEPFLLFKCRQVVLADGPLDKPTTLVVQTPMPGGVH